MLTIEDSVFDLLNTAHEERSRLSNPVEQDHIELEGKIELIQSHAKGKAVGLVDDLNRSEVFVKSSKHSPIRIESQIVTEEIKKKEQETTSNASLGHVPGPVLSTIDISKEPKVHDKMKVTAGEKWFNMPATEITPEVERDLKILKLRRVLDPKRFYKKDDSLLGGKKKIKGTMQFFQVGTIMDSPTDYYNRLTRKERKKTIVEELMEDRTKRQYFKSKFMEQQKKKEENNRRSYFAVKKKRMGSFKKMGKSNH